MGMAGGGKLDEWLLRVDEVERQDVRVKRQLQKFPAEVSDGESPGGRQVGGAHVGVRFQHVEGVVEKVDVKEEQLCISVVNESSDSFVHLSFVCRLQSTRFVTLLIVIATPQHPCLLVARCSLRRQRMRSAMARKDGKPLPCECRPCCQDVTKSYQHEILWRFWEGWMVEEH